MYKNKLKYGLNVNPKTIKILEENIGSTLFDTGLKIFFLDFSPEARETKAKINKWKHNKLKNFYTLKESTNKMKTQPSVWEKIFANYMPDKGLISKIYKDLTTQCQKTTNLILKWAEDLNRHFSKKTYRSSTGTLKKKKKLNITNQQRNTNQNHKIPSHTCQNVT